MPSLNDAISQFGADAKAKLANPSATGEPDDQLRAPLETLFADLAELCGFKRNQVAAVGETSLSSLKTRPDYAITLRNALVIKTPGKANSPAPLSRRERGARTMVKHSQAPGSKPKTNPSPLSLRERGRG